MRRFLIAALFGAPLLIAGPALAAVAETHTGSDSSFGLADAAEPKLHLAGQPNAEPAPLQVAHASDNALWWLRVGLGNEWRDGHRHRHRHDHHRHGWHKGHGKHGKHWNGHRHHSRHWVNHRRHDHDWDPHHRRHDHDWDRHRDRDHDWDRRSGHGHHRR